MAHTTTRTYTTTNLHPMGTPTTPRNRLGQVATVGGYRFTGRPNGGYVVHYSVMGTTTHMVVTTAAQLAMWAQAAQGGLLAPTA